MMQRGDLPAIIPSAILSIMSYANVCMKACVDDAMAEIDCGRVRR
jgi:hypothetical protein